MLGDGKWNSGDQGSFYKYQYGVLKLLESINAGIAGLPGIDYELIYTSYKAKVAVGGCYSINDFIQRIDIVNAATGAVTSTVWFNETTGTTLSGVCIPVPIANLDPYIPPSNTNANISSWLGSVAPTVGQKVMADSLPVVIASNQTAIPVSGPLTDAQLRATPVPVSGTVTAAEDKNYGVVGVNTLRAAAQIGNALGQADFNAGITTAQTLRVVLPTDQTAIPVAVNNFPATQPVSGTVAVTQSTSPWVVSGTVIANEDKNYGAVGVNTLRTAAQIGNALGAADFNAGVAGAQTLRVVLSDPNTATPQSITSATFPVGVGASIVNATSAGFTTDSAFTGSINGVTRAASTFYGFEATPGKTLPAIACVIGAGTITIDSIV